MGTARKKMTVEEIHEFLDRELGISRERKAKRQRNLRLAIPTDYVPEVLDLLYRCGNELEADEPHTGCTVLITAMEPDLEAANARIFGSGERDF